MVFVNIFASCEYLPIPTKSLCEVLHWFCMVLWSFDALWCSMRFHDGSVKHFEVPNGFARYCEVPWWFHTVRFYKVPLWFWDAFWVSEMVPWWFYKALWGTGSVSFWRFHNDFMRQCEVLLWFHDGFVGVCGKDFSRVIHYTHPSIPPPTHPNHLLTCISII